MVKKLISMGLVWVMIFTLASCSNNAKRTSSSHSSKTVEGDEVSKNIFAMDTNINMSAYGEQANEALEAAKKRIYKLESLWSVTKEESEIYAVNHSKGNPVEISEDTANIISFALKMADRTNGALDLTIYPILTAWGFTTGSYKIPTQAELNSLLKRIGYKKVQMNGKTIRLPEGTQIDLGAVGKGYACDIVTDILKDYGIKSAVVNFGGNVEVIGSKPDGSKWRVGIKDPNEDGYIGTLETMDRSIVTSGGYERYFTGDDGKVYWHILDPSNGKPADSGLVSVSIIGKESKVCDALSTSVFVMGLQRATEILA
ncbi:FAD:protein FMN transferase [Clostridium arbusti]|uniref:FAD:protein FMN transferase n=1 Tax=Clostridium arbusti TaxID=1137848 RepID=UPI000288CD72|nr:FAD:protein FMN transferase [Clostridium arbusti]